MVVRVCDPRTQEDYQEFGTSEFQVSLDYSKWETVSKMLIITLAINTPKSFSFCDISKKINWVHSKFYIPDLWNNFQISGKILRGSYLLGPAFLHGSRDQLTRVSATAHCCPTPVEQQCTHLYVHGFLSDRRTLRCFLCQGPIKIRKP